jgi:hypothetical protein
VDSYAGRKECGAVGCEFLSFGGSAPPDARVDCGGLVGGDGGDAASDRVCPRDAFFVVGRLEAGVTGDDGDWGDTRVVGTSVGATLGSGAGFNVGGVVH